MPLAQKLPWSRDSRLAYRPKNVSGYKWSAVVCNSLTGIMLLQTSHRRPESVNNTVDSPQIHFWVVITLHIID